MPARVIAIFRYEFGYVPSFHIVQFSRVYVFICIDTEPCHAHGYHSIEIFYNLGKTDTGQKKKNTNTIREGYGDEGRMLLACVAKKKKRCRDRCVSTCINNNNLRPFGKLYGTKMAAIFFSVEFHHVLFHFVHFFILGLRDGLSVIKKLPSWCYSFH